MGRPSPAAPLRALLLLLLLLPWTRATRALGPRISVPLGECWGAAEGGVLGQGSGDQVRWDPFPSQSAVDRARGEGI